MLDWRLMIASPLIPISRRGREEDPFSDVPYAGIPEHLTAPLSEWLLPLSNGQWGADLAQRVAVQLRLRAEPSPYRTGANYVAALETYASQEGPRAALDILDAVLFLHPGWPRRVGGGLMQTDGEWMAAVERLAGLLDEGGSVYRVNVELHRLEERVDPTVVGAFANTLAIARASQRERAAERLQSAWVAAYGLHPNPSAAVQDAVRAVEAAVIPVMEPDNRHATLGTVLGKLADPNFAVKWRLTLVQDRFGAEDGPGPLTGIMRTIWHSHSDRHEGNEPAPAVSLETGRAVVHAAGLAVQWILSGVLQSRD